MMLTASIIIFINCSRFKQGVLIIMLSGIIGLLKRYGCITKDAWANRKLLSGLSRRQDEYDFLPAHLELIERPTSAAPRVIAYAIIVFLIISLFISIVFSVEIVAVSPGKLALSGRSKVIQPIETSRVNKVYVKDGEFVKKGQILITLTAIGVEADRAKTESALRQAKLTEYRQDALLQAIESEQFPEQGKYLPDEAGNGHDASHSMQLLQEQFRSWKTSRTQQLSVISQRIAERDVIQSQIIKLEGKKHIASIKLNDIRKLYSRNAISKHEFLDQKNQYAEISNELDAQRSKLKEVSSLMIQADEQYRLLLQNFRRDTLEQLSQTRENIKQLEHELEKNKERQQALQIKSPVDGIVQQLAAFTEGGVVTTAQKLMVIVPEWDNLDAKVMISNKDIGFVRPGQPVVIKVEAFPYTRYGYLYGTVRTVSSEAIEDKEKGLYFDGEIILNKSTLQIEGKDVKLTSGMNVSAEIITGHRRVIDFILSPLQETLNESFNER